MGGAAREFPSTRWTLIVSSRDSMESRRSAMNELLQQYWKPLYFYARLKGMTIEAAKDAVQDFWTHLLEREFLDRLDRSKGRFRGYLRMALDHYLVNQYEARSAQKRGGGRVPVSLDVDVAERDLSTASGGAASDVFDREWALGVMERSLKRLEEEFRTGERGRAFDVVLKFFRFGHAPSYTDAAKETGMNLPQFKVFLHRTRARFQKLVREEVVQTVADAGDVESEISELIKALKS